MQKLPCTYDVLRFIRRASATKQIVTNASSNIDGFPPLFSPLPSPAVFANGRLAVAVQWQVSAHFTRCNNFSPSLLARYILRYSSLPFSGRRRYFENALWKRDDYFSVDGHEMNVGIYFSLVPTANGIRK